MMRNAILRSARCLVARPVASTTMTLRNSTPIRALPCRLSAPTSAVAPIRSYSAHAGLNQEEVQGRILDLLKNFDKVKDASKLQAEAHFANDLGLDSLDTVEVVMAIEEEFSIEIPDKEADAIHSVKQAVEYILKQPDGEPD